MQKCIQLKLWNSVTFDVFLLETNGLRSLVKSLNFSLIGIKICVGNENKSPNRCFHLEKNNTFLFFSGYIFVLGKNSLISNAQRKRKTQNSTTLVFFPGHPEYT